MKYKKQIAVGALAISMLIGGSSVFAASPQDLGIKTVKTYHKQSKTTKVIKTAKKNSVTGIITTISDTGFTVEVKNLKTKAVSSVDVKTDINTVYSKNGLSATILDLVVGQKVIITGALDKTTNIVTAKKVKIVIKTSKTSKKVNTTTGIN